MSIVIPCHNYGTFLGAAIESALNQTHQPIEVIVVDDGSSDSTQEVASRYPVTLVSQTQSGVCVAINNGIRHSRGPLVLRLDADDVLAPTYVAETLAALRQCPRAGFAYTEVAYFGVRTGTYPIENFDIETLAERNYVHGSALMRRSAFEGVGGYDPALSGARCEDWDLWLRFAERGFSGAVVRKPLLLYRQHPSASRNTLAWGSVQLLRRNLEMTARLQDNHPQIFATRALLRRLAHLPGRFWRREVSARFAVLLISFYGAMLARALRRSALQRLSVLH